MKYPSLNRVLSIVLFILSLALIGVGVAGIRDAKNDYQSDIRKNELMQTRLDTYEEYKGILKDKKKYSEALAEYNQLKEEYDHDHGEHKTDVAIHSATEGGLITGKRQLWEADEQIRYGYYQVETTKNDFDNHGETYNSVIGQAREAAREQMGGYTYPEVKANYDALVAGLSQFPEGIEDQLTLALQGQSEETVRTYLETAVTLISNYTEVKAGYDAAEAADRAADEAIVSTSAGLEAATANVAAKQSEYDAAVQEGKSGEELAPYESALNEAIAAESAAATAKESATAAKAATTEALATATAAKQQLEAGLTMAQIPLTKTTEEAQAELSQFNALVAAVNQKRELEATKATIEQTLPALEAADNQIVAMATQAFNAKIEESVKALNDAYAQIVRANGELTYKEWQLPQEQEELLERKLDLDKRADELAEMNEKNEKLKAEEKKFTSARILLESNPQIKESIDNGIELEEATKNEILRFGDELKRNYQYRLIICSMLLGAALFGILELFPVFEKIKSRFLRIAFVVLFVLLSAGAEALSVYIGRGHMYSALTSAIIGFICLLFIAPDEKRPTIVIEEPSDSM